MSSRALAASLVALALAAVAGCGGGKSTTTPAGGATTEEGTTTGATVPAEAPVVVSLYFLRDGKIGAARRAIVTGPRVGAAALSELLAGPSESERATGLETAIPAGTRLRSLAIAEDGIATVELSRELGSPEARAQVVFTLTQFATVRRVAFGDEEGETPVGRVELEEYAPPILVESPTPGEAVRSPLTIEGSANTFEATFQYELVGPDGRVLADHFVTATSGSGQRGTFAAEIPFGLDRAGPGKLVVFEISAEDGSRIHEVEIPLRLEK